MIKNETKPFRAHKALPQKIQLKTDYGQARNKMNTDIDKAIYIYYFIPFEKKII